MAIIVSAPKRNVLNWYQHDVSYSMELTEKFVEEIEMQVEQSKANYELQKKSIIQDEIPEIGLIDIIEVHRGLTNQDWDLYTIFNEFFPNLQRRSALLTLCGYFENELDKLCLLYESEKSYELGLSDINGKGIERSTKYLQKVARINVYKSSKEWNNIDSIHKIRNLIVHQDGKLQDENGNPAKNKKAILSYVNQMGELLQCDLEIVIKKGFLNHVTNIYKQYFKLLNDSIT